MIKEIYFITRDDLQNFLTESRSYRDKTKELLTKRKGTNQEQCYVNEDEKKIIFVTSNIRFAGTTDSNKNSNKKSCIIAVGTPNEPAFYPFKKAYDKYKKDYQIFFLSVCSDSNDVVYKDIKRFVVSIEPLAIPDNDISKLSNTVITFDSDIKKLSNKISDISFERIPIDEKLQAYFMCVEDGTSKRDYTRLDSYLSVFDSRTYKDAVYVTNWIATEMYKNNAKDLGLPRNLLIYGAPGTGKSHYIDEKFEKEFCPVDENKVDEIIQKKNIVVPSEADKKKTIEKYYKDNYFTRVTFYEDYSYENFVGCYKPIKKDDKITYEFEAGPFIDIYIKAKKNPDKPYLLAIEEINRANAAAVFGDLFQVLDRDNDGSSEYSVKPEVALNKYLEEHLPNYDGTISLPSNLYIWATMNSADQGVHVLDSAFKRRWQFLYMDIDNSESAAKIDDDIYLPVKDGIRKCKWNQFRKAINKVLKDNKIEEDRWVGAWFFKKDELKLIRTFYENKDNTKLKPNPLVDKLLAYLLQDVVKMNKDILFKTDYHNMSSIRKDLSNSNSPKNIFDILNIKIDENALEEVPKTENPTPTNAESAPNGQGEQTQVVTENG